MVRRGARDAEEYETGGEPMKARLLVLRYFDGLTEDSVMDFINASRNTYYAWKKGHAGHSGVPCCTEGAFVGE